MSKVSKLNRAEAYKLDKNGEFYAEFDEDSGSHCVFGTESGFAYECCGDETEAERKAEEMNRTQQSRFSSSKN